jgi:Trk K+ transport system NAD-binding subunit
MVEVIVPGDSTLVGQLLRDVPAPTSALVTAVAREGQVLLPRGDTRICPGDLLFVTTTDHEQGIHRIEQWVSPRPEEPDPDDDETSPDADDEQTASGTGAYGVDR